MRPSKVGTGIRTLRAPSQLALVSAGPFPIRGAPADVPGLVVVADGKPLRGAEPIRQALAPATRRGRSGVLAANFPALADAGRDRAAEGIAGTGEARKRRGTAGRPRRDSALTFAKGSHLGTIERRLARVGEVSRGIVERWMIGRAAIPEAIASVPDARCAPIGTRADSADEERYPAEVSDGHATSPGVQAQVQTPCLRGDPVGGGRPHRNWPTDTAKGVAVLGDRVGLR
jgi:hypothetical protein